MFLMLLALVSVTHCDWCGRTACKSLYNECVDLNLFACDIWNICVCTNTVTFTDGRRLLLSDSGRIPQESSAL